MNYFSLFIISFAIALSGACMPGPLLAAVISESTRHGFKTGPFVILGHALLELAMVFLLVFGFARFIDNPFALRTISLAGAFILFWFGAHMLSSLPRLSFNLEDQRARSSNLVALGITMSVSNPYWTIWWLTIGLGLLMGAQGQGVTAIVVFFIGHILADFGWYSIVSLIMSKGRRFISVKAHKRIVFACALVLIGFGVYFGISSSLASPTISSQGRR